LAQALAQVGACELRGSVFFGILFSRMRALLFAAAFALYPLVQHAEGFSPGVLPAVHTRRPPVRLPVLPAHAAKLRPSGPPTVAHLPQDRSGTPAMRGGSGAMQKRRPLLQRSGAPSMREGAGNTVKALALAGSATALLTRLCGQGGMTAGMMLSACYYAFRQSSIDEAEETQRIKKAVQRQKDLKVEMSLSDGEAVFTDDSLAENLRQRLSEGPSSEVANRPELNFADLRERMSAAASSDLLETVDGDQAPAANLAAGSSDVPKSVDEDEGARAPSQADIEHLNRIFGKSVKD